MATHIEPEIRNYLPAYVTANKPDLKIIHAPRVSKTTLTTGESFTLTATVCNVGDARSVNTPELTVYRYTGATKVAAGIQTGLRMNANASSDHTFQLTAPSTPGNYTYEVCIGTVQDEVNTGNNCSPKTGTIIVEAPDTSAPDLRVPRLQSSSQNLQPGESFTLTATVENVGTAESTATTLRFHQSGSPTARGTVVGTANVPKLGLG